MSWKFRFELILVDLSEFYPIRVNFNPQSDFLEQIWVNSPEIQPILTELKLNTSAI